MIGPRIKVKELACVTADTPEELCELASAKLQEEDGSYEVQGLPMQIGGQWIQFLVKTVLVIPKELMNQAQAQAPRIMPVQGRLPQQ